MLRWFVGLVIFVAVGAIVAVLLDVGLSSAYPASYRVTDLVIGSASGFVGGLAACSGLQRAPKIGSIAYPFRAIIWTYVGWIGANYLLHFLFFTYQTDFE